MKNVQLLADVVLGDGNFAFESFRRNKTALLSIIPTADDARYLIGEHHFEFEGTTVSSGTLLVKFGFVFKLIDQLSVQELLT